MHGWVQEMSPHPAFHWGRANGWAIMATAELLTVLPRDHPQRTQLLNIFRAHAAGLRRVQAPSGLWHQLLDRPDSYEETSSSAMFVFALTRAINKGWMSRNDLGSHRVTRLEWLEDESEFDRPGRGHLHRHGSRLGRYVLSQSPDGRERGARLRANLPGGLRDHLPAPDSTRKSAQPMPPFSSSRYSRTRRRGGWYEKVGRVIKLSRPFRMSSHQRFSGRTSSCHGSALTRQIPSPRPFIILRPFSPGHAEVDAAVAGKNNSRFQKRFQSKLA